MRYSRAKTGWLVSFRFESNYRKKFLTILRNLLEITTHAVMSQDIERLNQRLWLKACNPNRASTVGSRLVTFRQVSFKHANSACIIFWREVFFILSRYHLKG